MQTNNNNSNNNNRHDYNKIKKNNKAKILDQENEYENLISSNNLNKFPYNNKKSNNSQSSNIESNFAQKNDNNNHNEYLNLNLNETSTLYENIKIESQKDQEKWVFLYPI